MLTTGKEIISLALNECHQFVFAFGDGLIERYQIQEDRWESILMLEMPQLCLGMATVTMPDGIYLMGGVSEMSYSSQVLRFDTQSLEWHQMTDMKVPRESFTACSSGTLDYIYAIGGRSDSVLQLVERYDIQANRWEMVAPLSQSRSAHVACRVSTVQNQTLNDQSSLD